MATVTADPLVCGLAALALLVPLILPMFSLHLGQEDIAATPMETTERQAFDLLAREYGPGYNGPLLTATELSPPTRPSKAYEDRYNQAKANQADLERKQKSLTAESNSLKSQQASLERQQAQLQSGAIMITCNATVATTDHGNCRPALHEAKLPTVAMIKRAVRAIRAHRRPLSVITVNQSSSATLMACRMAE